MQDKAQGQVRSKAWQGKARSKTKRVQSSLVYSKCWWVLEDVVIEQDARHNFKGESEARQDFDQNINQILRGNLKDLVIISIPWKTLLNVLPKTGSKSWRFSHNLNSMKETAKSPTSMVYVNYYYLFNLVGRSAELI